MQYTHVIFVIATRHRGNHVLKDIKDIADNVLKIIKNIADNGGVTLYS